MLGVPRSALNYVVYGELDRQPLGSFIYPRMLKFWGKLVNANRNKLSKILYYSIIPNINTEKQTDTLDLNGLGILKIVAGYKISRYLDNTCVFQYRMVI